MKILGALLLAAFVMTSPFKGLIHNAYAREAQASPGASMPQPTSKVNINDADLEKLESIKGVGPALAERIVAHRNQNGKFKTIEDLKNVRGIGQAKFERLKDQITL